MVIAFTGHRNRKATEKSIEKIADAYPNATWIHGGAAGFDTQISEYARSHGINEIIIKPDYKTFGSAAPFIRNHKIVEMASLLIACYDGRLSGGTFYTIGIARKLGIPILLTDIQKQEK
jgi:hypothetical protein